MHAPRSSIIICVHNRPQQVLQCLRSLLAQAARDFEIVVVDDASTDETPARLAEFQQSETRTPITIVRNEHNRGVSGARNAGIEAARGKYIFFTDSDCTVDPDWLTALLGALADPEVSAVAGTVIDPPPRNWAERAYFGTTRVGQRGQGRPLVGNNMGFRADVLCQYGFDEAMTYGCDEDDLAVRLGRHGHRFEFAPRAVVYHHHPMTLRSYLNMAWRQGVGAARFWYKHNLWLGRDLWPLAGALLTTPLVLADARFAVVMAAFLALQLLALLYNEVALKGKGFFTAIAALPVCVLYYAWRSWAVARTLLALALGSEEAMRRSKQQWLAVSARKPASVSRERRRAA